MQSNFGLLPIYCINEGLHETLGSTLIHCAGGIKHQGEITEATSPQWGSDMIYKVWEEERGLNEALMLWVRENRDLRSAIAQARTGKRMDAHLARELDAVLDCRIRFQRLSLDFVQQIWPPAQKFVMRELPSLCIG
jgi:hypothetical protein